MSDLTVLEAANLAKLLEEKWGVSAAAPVAAAAGPAAAAAAPAAEKTEFTVVLTEAGDKKINVIKEIRAITGLGLKEAKDLVEAAPKEVKVDVNKDEAAKIKKPLMLHIAGKDQFVPPPAQQKIEEGLKSNPLVTIHLYAEMDHAFARVGGDHYDKACADLAVGMSFEDLDISPPTLRMRG